MSTLKQAETARWATAESKRNVWLYDATVGTQVDDFLVPAYWQRIGLSLSGHVRPWDLLEIREETGAFYIQAIVKSVSNLGMELAFLKGATMENVAPIGAATPIAPDLSVRNLGTYRKWAACKGEEVLKDGFETQALASQWITSYAKTAEAKP